HRVCNHLALPENHADPGDNGRGMMSRPIVADYKLLTAAGILSVFGIAMVYSAGQTDTPTAVATVYKSQILWLLIGVGFAYAVGRSSVRFIEWMTTPLYLFSMLFWAGVAWPLLILIASPAISLILSFSVGLWGAWFFILLALVLWYRPYLIEGIVLMVLNVATGVIAPMMWEKLAPYQQNRLKVFIDPSADPRASGYHVIQSKVAIGSGGFFGKGF